MCSLTWWSAARVKPAVLCRVWIVQTYCALVRVRIGLVVVIENFGCGNFAGASRQSDGLERYHGPDRGEIHSITCTCLRV